MSEDSDHLEALHHENRTFTEYERQRPFVLLQPKMTRIGEVWRVQYGDVSAHADTPDAASRAFDDVWAKGESK